MDLSFYIEWVIMLCVFGGGVCVGAGLTVLMLFKMKQLNAPQPKDQKQENKS